MKAIDPDALARAATRAGTPRGLAKSVGLAVLGTLLIGLTWIVLAVLLLIEPVLRAIGMTTASRGKGVPRDARPRRRGSYNKRACPHDEDTKMSPD